MQCACAYRYGVWNMVSMIYVIRYTSDGRIQIYPCYIMNHETRFVMCVVGYLRERLRVPVMLCIGESCVRTCSNFENLNPARTFPHAVRCGTANYSKVSIFSPTRCIPSILSKVSFITHARHMYGPYDENLIITNSNS